MLPVYWLLCIRFKVCSSHEEQINSIAMLDLFIEKFIGSTEFVPLQHSHYRLKVGTSFDITLEMLCVQFEMEMSA